MNERPDHNGATQDADTAFNRALALEALTRTDVATCREQAAAQLAAAEQAARAIGHRAEQRMQLARRIAERGVERTRAAQDTGQVGEAAAAPPEPTLLDAVTAMLAAELTGGKP